VRADGGSGGNKTVGVGGSGGSNADAGATASGSGGADDGTQAAQPLPPGLPNTPTLPQTVACQEAYQHGDTHLTVAIPRTRDYASPLQARGMLQQGIAPDAATVAPATFLNYYRNHYPDPAPGKIGIHPSIDSGALPNEWILQVGVQTPPAPVPRPKHAVVTVVVDTSISMAIGGDSGGMSRAKAAVQAIADALYQGDTLNVITTAPGAMPVALPISGPADQGVKDELDRLEVDGGEDMAGALAQAFQTASATLDEEGLNRVVLITDGVLQAGAVDTGLIQDRYEKQGIRFVSIGVGPAASYRDTTLSAAADAGHGINVYLDSPQAADELLHLRFDEVMDVVAADVILDVTVPWFFTVVPQEGEVAASDQSSLVSSEIGPGRSLVFRQILRACAADIPLGVSALPLAISITWTPAGGATSGQDAVTTNLDELFKQDPFELRKTSAILGYAEALRSLDEKRLSDAHDAIAVLLAPMTTPDPELDAIRALIEKDPLYPPAP
jgi:Ca-activated chloride channel family protein